ncbi:MAG: hypothetical protein IPG45_00080 [Deltaproteobacteria bacterium]|nr:hypothetical protein [Deltaproteobacteria bacterium]
MKQVLFVIACLGMQRKARDLWLSISFQEPRDVALKQLVHVEEQGEGLVGAGLRPA